MTEQKSFKRLVRARMEKTGESYTTARARLLRAEEPPSEALEGVKLSTSDETIRARTGRGWEEWFSITIQITWSYVGGGDGAGIAQNVPGGFGRSAHPGRLFLGEDR